MTLHEQYSETPAIGYYSMGNWGGLEILDILYGIDDYVVACFNWGTGRQQIRRHKVCFTPAGRAYFWKNHTRFYLDKIIRV